MMKKIKDESGDVVPKLYKDDLGTIVVKDNSAYNKYIQDKKNLIEISELRHEISILKEQMKQIMSLLNLLNRER